MHALPPATVPQHVAIIIDGHRRWAAQRSLIRTGGESRISNFMLWQMACTELFFTNTLWPDCSIPVLDQALQWFCARDRRFGASTSLLAC
ncbi:MULTISPECIES: undecaprenyl diphosphate synthase family protein [unclassified Polaromonas]|uniref:undecaprenyl diphosphate synthase family protein n=1 Tax=unclassified Polaromonas TaxID=2638319 RepID=UPI001A313472|nr:MULTISPECIES: undecaprenyl diphosphate synthase family protein [unclassified Polaromonas]MBG6073071.1 undecaprenyl pyrophosphate synthase [Polaromonas sp. CG_9.7]MBG6115076.1 undecaprenyl pyrophosphate synthase [Polaromonas sp. CG_9.2]